MTPGATQVQFLPMAEILDLSLDSPTPRLTLPPKTGIRTVLPCPVGSAWQSEGAVEHLQVGQAESWVPRLHGQTKETTFLGLFF